jgi:site-specific DNA recombinase
MGTTSRAKSKTKSPVRAVCYQRISDDKTGEEAGVTRQTTDTAAYCASKGWQVVATLTDNDLSASRYAKRKRPGYLEAIRLVEAGQANAIVAYHIDRLYRQPKELEPLIDLAESKSLIVATLHGEINLQTAEGRLQARILVAVSANESDNMSRRIRRKKDEMALEGLPPSDVRSFGWNRVEMVNGVRVGPRAGMIQIPADAEAIRDGARRFLSGDTLNSVARLWNAQGYQTPQGAKGWNGATVRAVLANPRQAGLRYANGVHIGKAAWPAIISETDHRRIVAKLADPSRAQAAKHVTLLTGLIRCGKCGHTLSRNYLKDGRAVLACRRRAGSDRGCNGIVVTALPLEKLIVDACIWRVDTPALANVVNNKPTVDEDALSREIAGLEASLSLRLEMFDAGDITRSEYLTSTKRLKSRLEGLQRSVSAASNTLALVPYKGKAGLLRSRWEGLSMDEKRGILTSLIDHVTIAPSTKASQRLDPNRVTITWQG